MRQLILVGYEAVLECDVCVLSHLEHNFAFHFCGGKTLRSFLNDESLNSVTIVPVSSPDNHVAESTVANPALLAIQDPAAIDFTSRRLQVRGVATVSWLGKPKAENLIIAQTPGDKPCLLFLVAESIDHSQTDAIVDQKE